MDLSRNRLENYLAGAGLGMVGSPHFFFAYKYDSSIQYTFAAWFAYSFPER